LIRVVISKEKYSYLLENGYFESTVTENYEYLFIQNMVSRSLRMTREKYGDNYNCLFRKDEVYDDIVKYLFFMFGNSLAVKAIVQPVRKYIKPNEETMSIETFIDFFDEVIKTIQAYMPGIIKVLLSTILIKVKEVFTIEANNYSPVYTMLFFNFLLSPRVQDMYGIGANKFPVVKSVNRIIRVSGVLMFRIFAIKISLMKVIVLLGLILL
jgi:hypothetical protein